MEESNKTEIFENLVKNNTIEKANVAATLFGVFVSAALIVGGTILAAKKGDALAGVSLNLILLPVAGVYASAFVKSMKSLKEHKNSIKEASQGIEREYLSKLAIKYLNKQDKKIKRLERKVKELSKNENDNINTF